MTEEVSLTKFGKICLTLKIIKIEKSEHDPLQADEIKLNKWNPVAWFLGLFILVTDGKEEFKKSF